MTEDEKQKFLIVTKELLRQAEPQLDNKEWQTLHDKMMADIAKDGPGTLSAHLLQAPIMVAEVIDRNNDRLMGMRNVVYFIERTDASELTPESITDNWKLADAGQFNFK